MQKGFKELTDGLPVDIYLINTCTVTHRADSGSLKAIHKAKKENPSARVIVTGCLAEKDIHLLAAVKEIDFIIAKKFFPERISRFSNHTRAFLKIQDGCNNFCSFCKVPYVRGSSRSRPLKDILEEARRLVENGFKELVLSGICLGAYGKDISPKLNLVSVIDALEEIEGLLRIRLSSIEPEDVSDALLEKMHASHNLCPHLHIPLQSGDDEILKKMRRNYTRSGSLNLIDRIRRIIPDIAITTDVLVGFPSETETNFMNTADLVKKISPLKVHIFPYSRREGTYAARNFKDELPLSVIRGRVSYLKKVAWECSFIYRKQFLDKDVDVLIEGVSKQKRGFQEGHADTYIKVLLKTNINLKNTLVNAKLYRLMSDVILARIK